MTIPKSLAYAERENSKVGLSASANINSVYHFGSRLAIKDGHLYATNGESGGGMIAQDPIKPNNTTCMISWILCYHSTTLVQDWLLRMDIYTLQLVKEVVE